MTASSIFDNLKKDEQILMERFGKWLTTNKAATESACIFLADKIGNEELKDDFKNFSDETKHQACLEYLAIGLTSGNVKKEEVEDFLKE